MVSIQVLLPTQGAAGGAMARLPETPWKCPEQEDITGTIYLVQRVGRTMRSRGKGRILLTGSIAGFIPGTYQAVLWRASASTP